MKKITAFVGSARKQHTHRSVEAFLSHLQAREAIEWEIVHLCDYQIQTCKGCKVCFEKGEEHCPLKDDRDFLLEKMAASDGVIFASPNYSFQVSGAMKVFLDRLGFIFHRPQFFGKTYTSIVAQGIYGGNKIVNYLDFVGRGLGFNTVKGACIKSLEPMTDKQQRKTDKALARQAGRFHAQMKKRAYPAPTIIKLLLFRMSRTMMKLELNNRFRDYTFFSDKGWFESDYYYPIRLGAFKRSVGKLFDSVSASVTRAR